MKQHRILFINHTAVLGGGELSLLNLLTAYRQDSKVILLSDGAFREKLEDQGIDVKVLPLSKTVLSIQTSSNFKSFMVIFEVMKMAQKIARESHEFELIHANSQKAFIIAALARFMGSPPIIWHLRDILTAKHFSYFNAHLAVRLANKYASKVIVNSKATGEAFINLGGKRSLVNVVYNGLNHLEIEPELIKKKKEEIYGGLTIKNVQMVGIFSRLSYWKGQDILLEALRLLPQNIHALIVGDALFDEKKYVTQLKKLSQLPELKGRIHWLGFRDDVPILMKICDVIVNPSTEPEPFGRVIVEAQLAQKPIIASASGGAIELIQDNVTGCLFPPGDFVTLARLIQRILSDENFAKTIGKQGEIKAKSKFSLEQCLENFNKVIEKV